jgi:hypothetical protein
MKRFVVSILAILYLFAGSGFLMYQHYCMGKLVDERVSYTYEDDDHACHKCGMEKKTNNGCCESKTKIVKKAYDEQVLHNNKLVLPLLEAALLPSICKSEEPQIFSNSTSFVVRFLQKPPPQEFPLFLKYRNLRI